MSSVECPMLASISDVPYPKRRYNVVDLVVYHRLNEKYEDLSGLVGEYILSQEKNDFFFEDCP